MSPAICAAGPVVKGTRPEMTVDETLPFRDKEVMKQRLDAAGIRTPRHDRAATADQVRDAAERIGYPVIVKPIAGAGSADTHRCDSRADLEKALRLVRAFSRIGVGPVQDRLVELAEQLAADGKGRH
mgnify:CR=1 FL=1